MILFVNRAYKNHILLANLVNQKNELLTRIEQYGKYKNILQKE